MIEVSIQNRFNLTSIIGLSILAACLLLTQVLNHQSELMSEHFRVSGSIAKDAARVLSFTQTVQWNADPKSSTKLKNAIEKLRADATDLNRLYKNDTRVKALQSRVNNLEGLLDAFKNFNASGLQDDFLLKRQALLNDRLAVEAQQISEFAFEILIQSEDEMHALQNKQEIVLTLVVLLLAALNISLLFQFKGRVLKPLKKIQDVAQNIQFGDFSRRVETNRNDELGELGKSINCMAVSLASQFQEAEQINNQLEQKVRENEATNEHLRKVVSQLRSTSGLLDASGRMTGVGGWTLNLKTRELSWTAQTYAIAQAPEQYKPVLEEAFALYDGPEAQKAITDAIERSIKTHEKINMELPFVTMQGKHIWVQVYGEVLHEKVHGKLEPKLLIGAFQDITARRNQQRKLEDALAQATSANAAKSEFLANMSHEIRTPLNGVIGLCYLLQNTKLDQKQKELVEKLESSGRSLLSLVSGILDLSKIETGITELEEERFDLEALFRELYKVSSGNAVGKNLTIDYEVDPRLPTKVIGDKGKIQQIMINLIGNALKFTHEGTVQFGCTLIQKNTDAVKVKIWVKDTGIGIEQNAIEKIFLPFTQADQTITKTYGGTGVGLALSTRFLSLMQSAFEVKSKPGQGSEFSFRVSFELPITQNDSTEFEWLETPTEPYEGQIILAVDDNELNLLIIESILKDLKVNVKTARSGQKALELIDTLKPGELSGCLMDIQMPAMSGIEACQHIHAKEDWQNLPVVALTAGVTTEERQTVFSAGMVDLLAKPIEIDKLKEVLRKLTCPVQQ